MTPTIVVDRPLTVNRLSNNAGAAVESAAPSACSRWRRWRAGLILIVECAADDGRRPHDVEVDADTNAALTRRLIDAREIHATKPLGGKPLEGSLPVAPRDEVRR
jgi:hypothetical protein